MIARLALLCLLLCATAARAETYQQPMRHFVRSEEQAKAAAQFAVYDPAEPLNRHIYKFNALFDRYIFLPLVDGYNFVVPDYADARISSFFANIGEFRNATNTLLQGKIDKTAVAVGRFVVNTTVGLLGLYDPATTIGLRRHDEDFGQTLAVWGVPAGAYVMLPALGPSNVRDTTGLVVDTLSLYWLVPHRIQSETAYELTEYGLKNVNTRAHTDFRYNESGSPFEYELVRYVTAESRRLLAGE